MSLGGDVQHYGTRGMRWGIRKKTHTEKLQDLELKSYKKRGKIKLGEVILAGIVAGPVGILAYAVIKRSSANSLRTGEALAGSIANSKVGSTKYSEAKQNRGS